MSVCNTPSNWFFFFVSRWNRAIFGPPVLHDPIYKTLFLDFWFSPPNAQNLLPKICTKSPIIRLLWQIDRRCLGLPRGFWGWPIQRNHANCSEADPCCHGNEIWARRGDLVAYRLVCWFVRSLRSLWFLEKYKSDFHEILARTFGILPNFANNFWKIKVKVQSQTRRTESIQIVIGGPRFELSSPNFGTLADNGLPEVIWA